MKPCTTGRHLTLRGTVDIADKNLLTNHQIFEFESNDLTKGWIVDYCYVWCSSPGGAVSSDGQGVFESALATDKIKIPGGVATSFPASDNRLIGWLIQGANLRSAGDMASFQGSSFADGTRMTIDPDHIINRDLFLNFYSITDPSQSPVREWSYLVGLSPVKLSPAESVLSMVKGVAQDIDN